MNNESLKVAIREGFAKLLATENLTVRHSNVETPNFHVKDRILTLPIYKYEISESLYNLFIAHEVSHALHDPPDKFEKFITEKPYLQRVFNSFDDIRVNQLIIEKYPGLGKDYRNGSKEIRKLGKFFDEEKIDEYNLLDRIRIHHEFYEYTDLNIHFEEDEKHWVKRAGECRTFEDVVSLSEDFYEDQKIIARKSIQMPENQLESETKELEDILGKEIERLTTSEVDEKIKSFQNEMLEKRGNRCLSVNIPEYDLSKIIVGYKDVHNYVSRYRTISRFSRFQSEHRKVVNYLVSRFEMKKKASLYTKSKISPTGILNTNLLHKYKFSDDVFLKRLKVAEGKNHGLVMFLDRSQSMTVHMYGVVLQLLNLVLFCRKINIPFEVYGFFETSRRFSKNGNLDSQDISFSKGFQLRQYFSHKMTNQEFKEACNNMLYLGFQVDNVPREEQLGTTPINQTIITAIQLVKRMKKCYNLDIINTIFLTDGISVEELYYNNHANLCVDAIGTLSYKNRKTWFIDNEMSFTKNLLLILKDICGCKNIGFHVLSDRFSCSREKLNLLDKDGFYEVSEYGFDAYYHILVDVKRNDVNATDDFYSIAIKSRRKQRVLLDKFIDNIT